MINAINKMMVIARRVAPNATNNDFSNVRVVVSATMMIAMMAAMAANIGIVKRRMCSFDIF